MYGKIFASMYNGSLYGQWQAIVTFQQMIVLCDIDGVVDMTPQAIAARTSIPLDIIQEGIRILEQPDKYSRTPDAEGRRIDRLDYHREWGWVIVNYKKYRHLIDAETVREQNRERQRRFKDKHKVTVGNAHLTEDNGRSLQVEEEAEVEVKNKTPCASGDALMTRFATFWLAYPKKRSRGDAEKVWKRIKPNEQLHDRILHALEQAKTSADWLKENGQFIPHPATWLNAKGWEDELSPQAVARQKEFPR